MTTEWLPGAKRVDLTGSRGNGWFRSGRFLGVVLHVNVDERGTSDGFYAAGPAVNPDSVTPNFQVYKDGEIHQYLPLSWSPWCQAAGNYQYAAIETAGLPSEPLTDAQVAACARIAAAYHVELGMPLELAEVPGDRGLGTHAMGGQSWGGHPCPGTIRAGQRPAILAAAKRLIGRPLPGPGAPGATSTQEDPEMMLIRRQGGHAFPLLVGAGQAVVITDPASVTALMAGGVGKVEIAQKDYDRIRKGAIK